MSSLRQAILERLDASGRYPGWVLFAVLAGMFAASFPFTILAVSLGPIAEELGFTRAEANAVRARYREHLAELRERNSA